MRRIRFEVVLVGLVLLIHLYAALTPADSLMRWFPSDDGFYYFKTAQNITEGHGISFDGLGRDSGFHPLWMALITPLFALARFDLILPLRLLVLLAGVLNAGTAVLLYRLTKRVIPPQAAALVGLFWAFYPMIHHDVTEAGLESGLSAFFIALLVYRLALHDDAPQADPRGWAVTGLIAALTVLARLDNIFLVLVAGAWLTFRPNRVRYLLIADAALTGLGVVWSYLARVGFGPQFAQNAASAYAMVGAALVIRLGLYLFGGLYRRPAPGWQGLARQLVQAAGLALLGSALLSGVMLGAFRLHAFSNFPRLTLLYEGGCALAAVLATRILAAWITRNPADADEDSGRLNWADTLTRGACFFVPLGLVLAAYMGSSLAYFGTPMPVSGQIKRWWGTLPNTIYGQPVNDLAGLLGFFKKASPWALGLDLFARPAFVPQAIRYLVYGGITLALMVAQRRRLANTLHRTALYPLLAGAFCQLISYTGTGYLHVRAWYWAAAMVMFTVLVGLLVDAALCQIATLSGRGRLRGFAPRLGGPVGISHLLVLLGCLALALVGGWDVLRRMPPTVSAEKAERYLTGTRLLEAHTEPGARIGSTGGGVIAYFIKDRTIVNMDGLMNTYEYFQLLQAGRAREYLDRIQLKYVYTGEYAITSSDPYFQFKNDLQKIDTFGGSTLFYWK